MNYTHFRFGVGCHDVNGFWYSPHLMTFDDKSTLDKQWEVWKRLESDLKRKKNDKREMLIDQHSENGDIGDTIIIPSKYADDVQRAIFGDQYEELKFDIFDKDVRPETVGEMQEKILAAGIEIEL